MGNIFERNVSEIWHGEEFAKARYYHETAQWDKVPFCKGCNGWAQYEYTEEIKDGLLIRRSPEYVYYNLIGRLSSWRAICSAAISRRQRDLCEAGVATPLPDRASLPLDQAASEAMRDGRGSVVRKEAPDLSFPRLAFKLRTEGFAWLKSRLASEVAFPTTRIGQIIHLFARRGLGAVAAIPRAFGRSVAAEYPHARDVLFAFYDLQVAPVTFDFLWFLAAADLRRRHLGTRIRACGDCARLPGRCPPRARGL